MNQSIDLISRSGLLTLGCPPSSWRWSCPSIMACQAQSSMTDHPWTHSQSRVVCNKVASWHQRSTVFSSLWSCATLSMSQKMAFITTSERMAVCSNLPASELRQRCAECSFVSCSSETMSFMLFIWRSSTSDSWSTLQWHAHSSPWDWRKPTSWPKRSVPPLQSPIVDHTLDVVEKVHLSQIQHLQWSIPERGAESEDRQSSHHHGPSCKDGVGQHHTDTQHLWWECTKPLCWALFSVAVRPWALMKTLYSHPRAKECFSYA